MSKRKRTTPIEKKLKDGHGQGIGIDYKPWLVIQDVSSLGRSTKLRGIKIPRQYEGKVRATMKERQNTLEYKRKELIEG